MCISAGERDLIPVWIRRQTTAFPVVVHTPQRRSLGSLARHIDWCALSDFDLLVIDTEDKCIRTGIGEELARFAGGNYHYLGRADSRSIARVVQEANM